MTNPNLKSKVREYVKLEKEILADCDDLPGAGGDCGCDDPDTFDFIHYGDYAELQAVCLNCGGAVSTEHY